MERSLRKIVKIGNLKVGGKEPVIIKGMLKSLTSQPRKLVAEAKSLEREGAQAIRMAVKEVSDVTLLPLLKKSVNVPFVADIHFDYRLALAAIESGFDGIRLNPMNINKVSQVRQIVNLAKKNKISIRVGINSGGFKKVFTPNQLARTMVNEVGCYLKILEREEFFDIMVSLKCADVKTTFLANRLFRQEYPYPLHLGVTATGPFLEAVVKSSLGIGGLLSQGIGEVLRVSLTAPSFWEIRVAKIILQSLNLRRFGPEIISCPTCSRCQVPLIKIVDRFKKELASSGYNKPTQIALMGCVVNGPGEAYQADLGVAFGKDKAAIFKKDKILAWTDERNVVKDLLKFVR